jgi:hypothetical protein
LGFIWRHRSDGGSTQSLKQNTVIRVSRLFVLCICLVFGGKYMEFRIIFLLQYSININTFEVDPPSDSLYNAVVKPKNRDRAVWHRVNCEWGYALYKVWQFVIYFCFFSYLKFYDNKFKEYEPISSGIPNTKSFTSTSNESEEYNYKPEPIS